MHLNESEVARFYSIWFPLLHFLNQQRKVVPSFAKEWRNAGVSPEVAVPVRDALWEDDALRDVFITENPRRVKKTLTRLNSLETGKQLYTRLIPQSERVIYDLVCCHCAVIVDFRHISISHDAT